jgi:uncharacterized protein YfeS
VFDFVLYKKLGKILMSLIILFEEKLWEQGYELHYIAKKIFSEDFFWSHSEAECPVSEGLGKDSFFAFLQWRINFPKEKPKKAVKAVLIQLGYEPIPENELASLNKKVEIDNPILDKLLLSIAFAQIATEGCVDKQLLSYALAAIGRRKTQIAENEAAAMKNEQLSLFRKKLLTAPIEGKEWE